jgi:hypothetical protein
MRFSLLTLMLFMVLAAVGIENWRVDREIRKLELKWKVMNSLARELIIHDKNKFAAVARHPRSVGEQTWDVYVPNDRVYNLCVSYTNIEPTGVTQPAESISIAAGNHRIEVQHDWIVERGAIPGRDESRILLDHSVVAELVRVAVGNSSGFSGSLVSESEQIPTNQPLILYRRVNSVQTSPQSWTSPTGPSDGCLVWIQPAEETKDASDHANP